LPCAAVGDDFCSGVSGGDGHRAGDPATQVEQLLAAYVRVPVVDGMHV
jgi:hypothetical protein